MNPGKPSAADRIRRGSPVAQPASGRTVSGDARVKPVRVTVDFDPAAYDRLRQWAFTARMPHAEVLRALVTLLDDPSVAERVRKYGSTEGRS